jgi:hypothetical protein
MDLIGSCLEFDAKPVGCLCDVTGVAVPGCASCGRQMKNPTREILFSLAAHILTEHLRGHISNERGTGGGAELVSDDAQFLALAGKSEYGLKKIRSLGAEDLTGAENQVASARGGQRLLTFQLHVAINAQRIGGISFHIRTIFFAVEDVVRRVMNDESADSSGLLADDPGCDGIDGMRGGFVAFSFVHRSVGGGVDDDTLPNLGSAQK